MCSSKLFVGMILLLIGSTLVLAKPSPFKKTARISRDIRNIVPNYPYLQSQKDLLDTHQKNPDPEDYSHDYYPDPEDYSYDYYPEENYQIQSKEVNAEKKDLQSLDSQRLRKAIDSPIQYPKDDYPSDQEYLNNDGYFDDDPKDIPYWPY